MSVRWNPRSNRAILLAAATERGHGRLDDFTRRELIELLNQPAPEPAREQADEPAPVEEPEEPTRDSFTSPPGWSNSSTPPAQEPGRVVEPAYSEALASGRLREIPAPELVRVEIYDKTHTRVPPVLVPASDLAQLRAEAEEAGVVIVTSRVASVGDTVVLTDLGSRSGVVESIDGETAIVRVGGKSISHPLAGCGVAGG